MQNALDLAFIESFGSTDIPEIHHRVFAYYESVTDSFLTLMKALLPWFFVLSAFYTASQITKVSHVKAAKKTVDNAYHLIRVSHLNEKVN